MFFGDIRRRKRFPTPLPSAGIDCLSRVALTSGTRLLLSVQGRRDHPALLQQTGIPQLAQMLD
jgi:hypothetical protein